MTPSPFPPQGGLLRGGHGEGEGHVQDGGHQVHPQESPEGEGDQHRERDRRAQEVSSVFITVLY